MVAFQAHVSSCQYLPRRISFLDNITSVREILGQVHPDHICLPDIFFVDPALRAALQDLPLSHNNSLLQQDFPAVPSCSANDRQCVG